MANALEELRRMRSETKSKETKLFPSRTYAGVMRIKDLEEGKSAFRIALHPKDNIPFVPLRTTYLEVEETIQNLGRYNMNKLIEERKLERALGVRKVEDLKEVSDDDLRIMLTDELGADFTMLVRKSIFISKFHGDRELPDIVEEYIRFANKMINDVCQDIEEQKKKRAPITGWKDKKTGQWNPGIMPSTNWVSYMFPIEQQSADLVRFEMYPTQMDDIEKLYQSFDTPDQPLTIDPFSDPEEGWPIEFDKGKDSKGKNMVTITEKKAPRTVTGKEFVAKYALTPSQIEELESKPSLTEMYVGVYSKRDYQLALNGLQIFDEKNELNVFENDEFLAIVEELTNHYANQGDDSDNDDQKEQPKKATPAAKKSTPKKDDMDILDEKPGRVKEKEKAKTDRRQELTDAIKALDSRAKILSRHTVEDLEEWLVELQEEEKFTNSESASDDTNGVDDVGELPEPVKEVSPSSIRERSKQEEKTETKKEDAPVNDRLASFRDRLKKRQSEQ